MTKFRWYLLLALVWTIMAAALLVPVWWMALRGMSDEVEAAWFATATLVWMVGIFASVGCLICAAEADQ